MVDIAPHGDCWTYIIIGRSFSRPTYAQYFRFTNILPTHATLLAGFLHDGEYGSKQTLPYSVP